MAKKKEISAKEPSAFKDIDRSIAIITSYPVFSKKDSKDKALEDLARIFSKGDEETRKYLLFAVQNKVASVSEMKVLQTYEYCRSKNPKASPAAVKSDVLGSMFDYTSSTEGISCLLALLGVLKGHDAAKLLTRLFSHFCASESEVNRMLRNAVIEALGESGSSYALDALLDYARLTDNDKLFGRLVSALGTWSEKIEALDLPEDEKQELRNELKYLMAKEEKPTQYG